MLGQNTAATSAVSVCTPFPGWGLDMMGAIHVGSSPPTPLEKRCQASHPMQLRKARAAASSPFLSSPFHISPQHPLPHQHFPSMQAERRGQEGSCKSPCGA